MVDLLEAKLAALEEATKAYRTKNSLAAWVYMDIAYYIRGGKATRAFEEAFIYYPDEEMPTLIERCLKRGLSTNAIIQTAASLIGAYC